MISSTALTIGGAGDINNNSNNNNGPTDPYLKNDFHPLSLASSEILTALRADESAPDADLYRRLISSSGVGAHRYHVVTGENDGCGEVDQTSSSSSSRGAESSSSSTNNTPRQTSDNNNTSSSSLGIHGNVIGSPLGLLRTRRTPSSSSRSSTNNDASIQSSLSAQSKTSKPPTSYLKHTKSLPIPNKLATQAQNAQLSSLMGLLPEANLVWMTCDDTLFLWSYKKFDNNGNSDSSDSSSWSSSIIGGPSTPRNNNNTEEDYCSFTVPSGQCIVSIGLVKPKHGVFKKEVKWCLVVTTPEEVMLCALSEERVVMEEYVNVDEGNPNEGGAAAPAYQQRPVMTDINNNGGFRHGTNSIMRLIPTRYILPTDSIPIVSITGTKSGRIFLGGYDGNLYEFMYDGNHPKGSSSLMGISIVSGISGSEVMERAIDDYFDGRGVFTLGDGKKKGSGALSDALSGSKRVVSALTFGVLDATPPSDNDGDAASSRPRKCRKINHSSTASGLISSVVPGTVLRVASSMFGSSIANAAKKCGPIVDIVLDEDRLCLYTLGSKGVICVYDIAPLPSSSSSSGNPPRLSAVLDAIGTTKLYLDSVSRGRMYPPTTSQNVAFGTITFPGGNASAQAGVGGMEGAREILKKYDLESRVMKSVAANNVGGVRGIKNELSNTAGILHPVSIHLVKTTESKSLTLVAITGGGLRYYLSSLSSSYINSAQVGQSGYDYTSRTQTRGGNMDPRLARMRPGRKVIFCHVRAPPPYTSSNCGNDGFRFELAPSAVNLVGAAGSGGGLPPGIYGRTATGGTGNIMSSVAGDVVKGSYGNGVFVLALDVEKTRPTVGGRNVSSQSGAGDIIVAALPDLANRVTQSSTSLIGNTATPVATKSQPGGISESIELPMSGINGTMSPILPGGRTFDISTNSDKQSSSVISLFVHSETPTDVELQVGLLPSFVPRKKSGKSATVPKNGTSSSSLVVSTDRGRGLISSALSTLSYYIRSGQAFGYPVGTISNKFEPTLIYRVSRRAGCDSAGFSNSAGESFSISNRTRQQGVRGSTGVVSTVAAKSARLPSWLLRPSPAPLNSESSQHLLPLSSISGKTSDVLVLNSGGLHFFSNSSLLNNLASVLLRANNVAKDSFVLNFFTSYGYIEGCAMCFSLATSSSSSAALRGKAEQAALTHANRPQMMLTGPTLGDGLAPITSYTFQPSSLYEGLVRFISRLLRPFWFKPGVVVTEGRPIHSKSVYANYYAALPGKVELLLDDATLEEIRRPLLLLQTLMKKTFVPVVQSVPGGSVANKGSNDAMDVDDSGSSGGLITRALQSQNRAATQRMNNPNSQHAATPKELQTKAFHTEDRNMHSLYRLVSRAVQVLNLMACLKRAHETPSLPEVQWGSLHGLTYYQLVTNPDGQARIEALLNALVSQGEKTLVNGLSTDGDQLADTLSRQCYLFFSSASRLTYLGFRSANEALSRPISSPQRSALSNQAASYLRAASRHWYSPALIAGRKIPNSNGANNWEDVAMNAKECGSPLALAADILMKLGNVEGLVDVCLICASSFGGAKVQPNKSKEMGEENFQDMLGWERGLYHRPPSDSVGVGGGSTGTQIVPGIDVTSPDALRTCHSIIFHYISKLLRDGSPSSERLAQELVTTCTGESTDTKFLHSLYEYLLSTNNVETALRIDSSSLEDWLVKEKKDINLLWKYYSYHGRSVLAGSIMLNEATEENKNVPLDRRIECFTRAANSFEAALSNSSSATFNMNRLVGVGQVGNTQPPQPEQQMSVEDLRARINQIQEQLDVATIQKRVLTTISQSQDVNLEEAKMDALIFTLLDVSSIYNEYAAPLNLFDVVLLILETCRQRETATIATLWKSIICEEVLPCSTSFSSVVDFLTILKQGSLLEEETIVLGTDGGGTIQEFENGEWIPRLRNRVASLGKELFGKGADYTFPLDLIVRELEGMCE